MVTKTKTPDELLSEAAATFKQRNSVYGNQYLRFGSILEAMFPGGLTLETVDDFNRFTMFVNCLAKLSRYSVNLNRGGHKDSAHDLAVYAAMLEGMTDESN